MQSWDEYGAAGFGWHRFPPGHPTVRAADGVAHIRARALQATTGFVTIVASCVTAHFTSLFTLPVGLQTRGVIFTLVAPASAPPEGWPSKARLPLDAGVPAQVVFAYRSILSGHAPTLAAAGAPQLHAVQVTAAPVGSLPAASVDWL
jgi:hypothetical protein